MADNRAKPKRGGLLSRLKSGVEDLIFEKDANLHASAAPVSEEPAVNSVSSAPSASASSASAGRAPQIVVNRPAVSAPVDAEMRETLLRNIVGQSPFAEFSATVASLESAIPDLLTRRKAALAVLAREQIEPSDILRALEDHLARLPVELDQFSQAAEQKAAEAKSLGERELAAVAQSLQLKKRQIADLQAEIERLEADRAALMDRLADSARAVEETKARFLASHRSLSQELHEAKLVLTQLAGSPNP